MINKAEVASFWCNNIYSNKKENEGIGLKNMNDRAKTLNSKLNVTSDLGRGTKIEVAFKI